MSIEITEDNVCMTECLFLPPTVLAVKQLAASKTCLFMGVFLFMVCVFISICDLTAGAVLLPLAALLLISHIRVFKKAKSKKNNLGFKLLATSYILSSFLLFAYYIFATSNITEAYFLKFSKLLLKIISKLPSALTVVINNVDVKAEIISVYLSIIFLLIGFVAIAINRAKRLNFPSLSIALFSAVVCSAISIRIIYNVVTSLLTEIDFQNIIENAGLISVAVFTLIAVAFCVIIFLKMKKVKNVIQK